MVLYTYEVKRRHIAQQLFDFDVEFAGASAEEARTWFYCTSKSGTSSTYQEPAYSPFATIISGEEFLKYQVSTVGELQQSQ